MSSSRREFHLFRKLILQDRKYLKIYYILVFFLGINDVKGNIKICRKILQSFKFHVHNI